MKTHHYLPGVILFLFLALLPSKNMYSQGFYFNLGGGYGFNSTNLSAVDLCAGFNEVPYYYYYNFPSQTPFSFAGANQTYTETYTNGQQTYSSGYQALNKGFGGGFHFFASAGYAFTKNINAEIGFSYLAGTTLQSSYSSTSLSYDFPDDTSYSNESISGELTSSPRYRLMPAIKFSVPLSKFTPYLKAGLVVGLGGKLTLSNAYSESGYTIEFGHVYNETTETANTGLTASGELSLGYTASAGVEYALADFLSVYCEINLINENWSPANGDITTYTASGVTPPYLLTSSQFTYSDNITTGGGVQTSSNNVIQVNSQYPKQTFSYGSYGVDIGIKFSIPNKKAVPPSASPAPYVEPKTN